MTLACAEAGRIRNHDIATACGRERKKLEEIVQGAHFAWRAAENARHVMHRLQSAPLMKWDRIATTAADDAVAIDFAALDRAKRLIEDLINKYGGELTFEMQAADYSLLSVLENVDSAIAEVAPARKCLQQK